MAHNHSKVQISLKKAKSSLERISKMIEDDKYCIDIIQQVLAVVGMLRSTNEILLEGHLQGCYKTAIENKKYKKAKDMTEELIKIMKIAQKK